MWVEILNPGAILDETFSKFSSSFLSPDVATLKRPSFGGLKGQASLYEGRHLQLSKPQTIYDPLSKHTLQSARGFTDNVALGTEWRPGFKIQVCHEDH